MKRRGRFCRASAILLLAAGCSREAASARTLAACSVPRVDTAGWVRTEGPYRGFSFRLPPSFRRDTVMIFDHGGVAWRDGRREVHLINGHWSPASFRGSYLPEPLRDPMYSECRDTIAGIPVFLSTRNADTVHMASGWFRDPHRTGGFSAGEIVLGGRGPTRDDQILLLAIIRTVAADSAQ